MPENETTFTLEGIVRVLARGKWIMAIVVIIVTLGTFAVVRNQPKRYTATADLVFSSVQPAEELIGVTASSANDTSQQETNLKIVTLGTTAQDTAQKVGHGLTAEKVRSAITTSAVTDSNIVQVSATAATPELAAAIANTYSSTFVANDVKSAKSAYKAALAIVEAQLSALTEAQRQSGAGAALEARAQSLAELAELQSGIVQVAQVATVPSVPSSPKVARATTLGAVGGIILALVLVFALDRFDQRIREPSDLERIFGLPVLAAIPTSAALSTERAPIDPLGQTDESFRMLRAHLQYFRPKRAASVKVIVVISPVSGDGKTTVAINLALAAASSGTKTLMIDADIRRPSVAHRLGLKSGDGLAEAVVGRAPYTSVVQRAFTQAATDVTPGLGLLDVLTAGSYRPPNPGQLLAGEDMATLLTDASSDYDLVIVDTSPLGVVSDAYPLLTLADGVVVVVRLKRRNRDMLTRLRGVLAETDAVTLGVVANGIQPRSSAYTYDSNYGASPNATSQNA